MSTPAKVKPELPTNEATFAALSKYQHELEVAGFKTKIQGSSNPEKVDHALVLQRDTRAYIQISALDLEPVAVCVNVKQGSKHRIKLFDVHSPSTYIVVRLLNHLIHQGIIR